MCGGRRSESLRRMSPHGISSAPKAVSPSARRPRDPAATAPLVAAAAGGDADAWAALVARFGPVLRTVARDHHLQPHDADDVAAACWLALFEGLDGLRDPDRLHAWLVTAARRQALRARRHHARVVPVPMEAAPDEAVAPDGAAPAAIAADRARALRAAVARLPHRQRVLLEALLAEPEPSYAEVAARLGMPRGAVGPTRLRGLERLRRDPALAAALAA
jgi:RNA polymerase sigma factor (sigma-70 family)